MFTFLGRFTNTSKNKNVTQTKLQQNTIKTQAIQAQHKQNTNKTQTKHMLNPSYTHKA